MRTVKRNAFLGTVCAVLGGLILAAGAQADPTSDTPAGLVVFPKVIVGSSYDTVIQLSNTSNELINVRCYLVNANSHCTNAPAQVCDLDSECNGGICAPGWTETDFRFTLTRNQPIAWVVSEGLPGTEFPLDGLERIFAFVDSGLVVAESDESNNVGDSGLRCGPPAEPSPFEPVVEMHWPLAGGPSQYPRAIDSLSTPIVVQLTDDNGDGKWDERDVPDIVFVAVDLVYTLEPEIALRAIRGDTGAAIFDINGFFPGPLGTSTLFSLSGLAAGDIDNDGKPEIVTTLYAGDNLIHAY